MIVDYLLLPAPRKLEVDSNKICEIEKNVIHLIPKQKIKSYKILKESETVEMLKKLKTIEISLIQLIDINKKYNIFY